MTVEDGLGLGTLIWAKELNDMKHIMISTGINIFFIVC
jgi:hypothetical protein